MNVEILYLACNRLEFTKVSFRALIANTDWSLVDRLVVYDDGSVDGTSEWLEEVTNAGGSYMGGDQIARPVEMAYRKTRHGSPVAVMLDYLETSTADVFAKVDNDIALAPGWLDTSLNVMERCPEVDLLGLAAGWTGIRNGPPGYQLSSHIGGVGLMRRRPFDRFPDLWAQGRQGFTQYQHAHPEIVRGWIQPDLPVVQLDLIPEEPWRSLADYYVGKRWARAWPPYNESDREWWSWIEAPVTA